jgi:hypothetical protein
VFEDQLDRRDSRRVTDVADALLAHGLRCALTGGLAIDAQLRAHGRPSEPRPIGDIDLVVEDFASIPASVAGSFLPHHVHPDAVDGKLLLQLVDEARAVRIDVFRAFESSLARARRLNETGLIPVLSVEDLVARTTALVFGRLRRGETIDVKHAKNFGRLRGLGEPDALAAAWNDHRQQIREAFDDASHETAQLIESHPELLVIEKYSTDAPPCPRCRHHGPLRPAPLRRIVDILGYC